MSDVEKTRKKTTWELGLATFWTGIKRYGFLGVIVPLILLLPSIFIQILWFWYDSLDMHFIGISTIPSKLYTESQTPWIRLLEAREYMSMILGSLLFAAIVLMAAYVISDLIRCFFGKKAGLELCVPCPKPVLFVSRSLAAGVMGLCSCTLLSVQEALYDGFLAWDHGLYLIKKRNFIDVGYGEEIWNITFEPDSMWHYFFILALLISCVMFLFCICGKLQKRFKEGVVALLIGAIAIGSFVLLTLIHFNVYSLTVGWMRFAIPLVFLIIDILLFLHHDTVTT